VNGSWLARSVVCWACICIAALVGCKPSASGASPTATAAATSAATQAATPVEDAEAPFDASNESAFTQSAARLFRKASTKVAVEVLEPLTLKLDFEGTDKHDIHVSLDRMWNVCQSDPPGCEGAMNDFVAKVMQTVGAPQEPATRDRVVAVVRPRSWFESMGTMPEDKRPLSDPLVDDLSVVYAVDLAGAVRSLSRDDLDALKLTRADLPALARANLAARLGHVLDLAQTAKEGDVSVLATGNYYESSRLLLTDDWAALSASTAQTVVVSVPTGDAMFVVAGGGATQLAKLRELTATAYEHAQQRPVSRRLFRWNAGSWAVLK
jgi:uncharacterized protein YtpQ (UPF0354 family)